MIIMLRTTEMRQEEVANEVHDILRAANKHPTSKVAKLIHTVKDEPNQRNIVLLLIELAEHTEYSVDFSIPLKYYLNLFEEMCLHQHLILNEAGLLLVNSSKIYARRVDYVISQVERQVLSLSTANTDDRDRIIDTNGETATSETTGDAKILEQTQKRRRKRVFDITSADGTEIELIPKRLCIIDKAKRFADPKSAMQPSNNINNSGNTLLTEDYIHPNSWLHGTIYDLDHEDEIDSKRNYKLFTYHVEHRFNTLVPDINFRLHFKIKDFLNLEESTEEGDDLYNENHEWPVIPDTYIQKYITLENRILQQEIETMTDCDTNSISNLCDSNTCEIENSQLNSQIFDSSDYLHSTVLARNSTVVNSNEESPVSKALTSESTPPNNEISNTKISDTANSSSDNIQPSDMLSEEDLNNSAKDIDCATGCSQSNMEPDLENLSVRFNGNDMLLSDLCRIDNRIFKAKVRLKDVMRQIQRKNDGTSIQKSQKHDTSINQRAILSNILKIPEKHLYKRSLFKLGEEFKLFTQLRTKGQKRSQIQEVRSNNINGSRSMLPTMCNSPSSLSSPIPMSRYCSPLLGFSELSGSEFEGFNDDSCEKFTSMSKYDTLFRLLPTDKENTMDSGIGFEALQSTVDGVGGESDGNTPQTIDTTDSSINTSNSRDDEIVVNDQQSNSSGLLLEAKIRQWHEYLRPILCRSRERHHFDVFDIGTEIMQIIQGEQVSATSSNVEFTKDKTSCETSMESIMDGKDKSHVSRYFLSTLLLVNQANVQLTVPSNGGEHPIDWSDIQLKLISTTRYRVDFDREGSTVNEARNPEINSPPVVTLNGTQSSIDNITNNNSNIPMNDRTAKCLKRRSTSLLPSPSISLQPSTSCQRPSANSHIDGRNLSPKKQKFHGTSHVSSDIYTALHTLRGTEEGNDERPEASVNGEMVYRTEVSVSFPLQNSLPSTVETVHCKRAMEARAINAYLALETLKPLVTIKSTERRNDDLDSGIFSNGDVSVTC